MSRLSATNIMQGTGRQDGQLHKSVNYCPQCKAYKSAPHKIDCKGEFVKISTTARLPRLKANKKVWLLFNKKFVDNNRTLTYFYK